MQETRARILDALASDAVAGPTLADRLDVSRAAVWKHVEALREAGFVVESTDDGYELVDIPEFGGEAVEYGLDAPFSVEYHDTIDSTNRRAREIAQDGREDVAVLADEQTGGRGRLDREWSSPSGGIWLSLACRPDVPLAHAPVFTLAAAVAVTRAAREAGVDAGIKWPNDVVVGEGVGPKGRPDGDGGAVEEAKLAGILTEVEGEADRTEWVVVGIGINANVGPEALPTDVEATSIREAAGSVDRRVFTQRLLENFDEIRRDVDTVVDSWREYATTLGKHVRVETPSGAVEGDAVDVAFPGALVVDTGEERVRITAGDCEHLRPA